MSLGRNRVVAIRSMQSGSGFLISPRLILTAAHVVGAAGLLGSGGAPIQAYANSRVGAVDCSVVWSPPLGDTDLDVVLLSAQKDLVPPDIYETFDPIVWGELRSLEPRSGCFATGFPRVGKDPGSPPRPEQFWGTLAPGTDSGDGKLVLSSEGNPPLASPGESSPWAGLSGAAVFFRRFLIGVVIEDDRPKRWQHSRVGVLAIAKLFEDDSFIETLRDHLGRAVSLTGITEQEIIDAEFEGKYAEAMRVEHGKIRIFGLDLSRSHGRGLDLETAYLSLEALSSPTNTKEK